MGGGFLVLAVFVACVFPIADAPFRAERNEFDCLRGKAVQESVSFEPQSNSARHWNLLIDINLLPWMDASSTLGSLSLGTSAIRMSSNTAAFLLTDLVAVKLLSEVESRSSSFVGVDVANQY